MIEFVILTAFFVFYGITISDNRNNPLNYLKICLFILFLLSALRAPEIGNDTKAYNDIYSEIVSSSDWGVYGRFEVGFVVFCQFLSLFCKHPQILIAVSSCIIYLAFYNIIKRYSTYYVVALLIFFTCGLFRFSLSAIRQCLAISVLIYGFIYYYNNILSHNTKPRSKIKLIIIYFLCVALATSFHTSSIVTGTLLFFCFRKWSFKHYIVISIGVVIVMVYLRIFINNFLIGNIGYSRYIGSDYDSGLNVATLFLLLMCLIDFYILSSSSSKSLWCFKQIVLVKILILILSFNLNAIDRLADTFTIFEIVGVSCAIKSFKINKRNIFATCIVLMYFSYSMVWGIYRPLIQMIWPYHFFMI